MGEIGGQISDLGAARAVTDTARSLLTELRGTAFWKIPALDLLALAQELEGLRRLSYAALVHLAGELDVRGVAGELGATSTAALLRQTMVISAHDATAQVNVARALLPKDAPSGGQVKPVLPLLADAVAAGQVGVEQTRTIVTTMRKLPAAVDPETRGLCQKLLVENGVITEPKPFADFARAVALSVDPDGKLDDTDPADRVELNLGVRNAGTGMTRFTGQLDDLGMEVLQQAIGGLSAPRPSSSAGRDPRSASCRRGQALVQALRSGLDRGGLPAQGGERPHITVTISLADLMNDLGQHGYPGERGGADSGDLDGLITDDLIADLATNTGTRFGARATTGTSSRASGGTGSGTLEYGGPISPAQARMLACDAKIIPAILGSPSQVLDVGTASRSFPAAIRRALELRDRGCSFPGCDRPAGWSDGHHVKHWAKGGKTCLGNATLLCPLHHGEIHRGHWVVRIADDGLPEFIPPPWVDPHRKPRRNNAHHIDEAVRP